MASRGQSLTVVYHAWDTGASAYKTGDVANQTLRIVKDGVSAAPTNAPAEIDATNLPGAYSLALTAAECTANLVHVGGKSSTSGVVILPVSVTFEQLPTAAPGAAGGLPYLALANGHTVFRTFWDTLLSDGTWTIVTLFSRINEINNHADDLLLDTAEILTHTSLITPGGVTISSLVDDGGTITVVPGDDYTAANGRAYVKTFIGGPSLAGADPVLELKTGEVVATSDAATSTITGSGTEGDPWTVTCPLLAAESVQLVPGKYAEGARLRITRSGGDIITPIDYTLKVKPNLTG
jgi:hypothetical protein